MLDLIRESLSPEAKSLLRPWLGAFELMKYGVRLPWYRLVGRFKWNDPDSIYTEEYFQKRKSHPFKTIASCFAQEIVKKYDVECALDIGCAIGMHLRELQCRGVITCGFEGSMKAVENAVIENIWQMDIRNNMSVNTSADLVISIEVAEHIHPKYADNSVSLLSSSLWRDGVAIVSAAEPGQLGTHHVNLQRKDYWVSKFSDCGLRYMPRESVRFSRDLECRLVEKGVSWVASDNLMIFRFS